MLNVGDGGERNELLLEAFTPLSVRALHVSSEFVWWEIRWAPPRDTPWLMRRWETQSAKTVVRDTVVGEVGVNPHVWRPSQEQNSCQQTLPYAD